MTQYWTHYWTQQTLEDHKENCGHELIHTAGEVFLQRGVKEGDFVYCLSSVKGSVVLMARIKVAEILPQAKANEYFGKPVWPAKDHLIALPGNGSIFHLDRVVPIDKMRALRFITRKGETRIKFQGDSIDQQTLRQIRELTEMSARLLDEIIDPIAAAK